MFCVALRIGLLIIFLSVNSLHASEINSPSGSSYIETKVESSTLQVQYRLHEEVDVTTSNKKQQFYEISVDGGKIYTSPQKSDPKIKFRNTQFDPAGVDEASIKWQKSQLQSSGSMSSANNLSDVQSYLVQFYTRPMAAYKEKIKEVGAKIVAYIPEQTIVVHGNANTINAIKNFEFVRWVGEFKPEYKVSTLLKDRANNSRNQKLQIKNSTTNVTRRYNVVLFSDDNEDIRKTKALITSLNIVAVSDTKVSTKFLQLMLTDEQLQQLLNEHNIESIEEWLPPEADMDIVRQVGGADYLQQNTPYYTGMGVAGEIMDIGGIQKHQDFLHLLWHGPICADAKACPQYHATSVYGIVFGTGKNDSTARGLLPDGVGYFANNMVADRAAHTAELVNPTGNYRALFQTNSWGDADGTTTYNITTAALDDIIFKNNILILHSQGNFGSKLSRAQSWAKNVVSVGAVKHQNTTDLSDDHWGHIPSDAQGTLYASIGPAADGRIKPDLIAFGDSIHTTASEYSSDSNHISSAYDNFGETSAATPIVAGHFGLMFQMWADGIFTGKGYPGMSKYNNIFDVKPNASTAKAIMINTAQQYNFSGETHDLTRTHQGWGLPNVKNLYDVAKLNNWSFPLVVDADSPLQDQASAQYIIKMTGSETTWLKATMVYMDPPGSPTALISTVNDLDLQVTSPSGLVYWGNMGLLTGNWSVPGGSSDTVDTVENVFIQNAEKGDWKVRVIAKKIVIDAYPTNQPSGAEDAAYSLVVTCGGENLCQKYLPTLPNNPWALSWLVPVINLILM